MALLVAHDVLIDACARAAHEAVRAVLIARGGPKLLPWEYTPLSVRALAREAVPMALDGAPPEDLYRRQHGDEAPTWSRLPDEDRALSALYARVARATAQAFGHPLEAA